MPIKAISGTFRAHSHCQYLVFLIEIGPRSHKAVGISIKIANGCGSASRRRKTSRTRDQNNYRIMSWHDRENWTVKRG